MKTQRITNSLLGIALTFITIGAPPLRAQPAVTSTSQFINQPTKSTMENQAAATVKTFLTAVQKGDQATFGALVHPNIQWNQPGSNRLSGTKKSSTEVFQMVGLMFEATANTLRLTDIKQLAVNGNKVACLVHWNGVQPGGGVLDVDNIDVYTVENGKIVEAAVYSADLKQEDYFWGK
ncbi:nuclear transport factor 2 family protein [Spirosoma soli]|uniref:Nuclear transport factor 2 family protein n=1 Tax=Spirosoma soli TaxID=1770529 RepID=A0ABW5M7B9_9BACT